MGDKLKMKKDLQLKYDQLFADNWKAPLSDRKALLLWACEQRNNYMTEKGNEAGLVECGFSGLLDKYGPDYHYMREKVGFL
mmetsp:Transcript_24924/g.28618  ORF Transcript_24924/g.28618 Transcript_24924/m.28618 type:complete len:81 (+) Transcript_24924:280-522(+)